MQEIKDKENQDTEDMAFIPGGTFLMGSEDADANREDNEGPVREAEVAGLYRQVSGEQPEVQGVHR